MKRPLESDYTSQAAYTRALEMYCEDNDTQTYKEDGNALLIAYQSGYFDAKKKYKEVEIDFADFLIIAQAVVAKLKELNNG